MNEAYLWNEIGLLYQRLGLPDEALRFFLKAIELAPEVPMFYCNLADVYFSKREFGHALAIYKKSLPFLKLPSEQAYVWNRIGNTYRALKDLDNAFLCFQKADQYEMQLGGLSTQTDSLTSLPNPKNEDMRKSTGATSNDEAPVSFSGGASTWPSVSTSKVTPDFADANPMPPSLTSGQDNTGDSKLCDTAPHQAAKQAGEISVSVETEKENKSVFVIHERPALEEILARIRTYERITTAQPSNHSAWDTLGKLYKSIERYQDALWAYHEALKWDSKNESYWYYLGLLYSIEQQPEDARLAFEQVLSLRPDHTLAHSALAGIYRRKGMEARANFHIAAAMKKIHLESAYNRACFYAICEERDTALEYLKQALEAGETTVRWVQVDPDLASLRSDQRYQQLLHRFEQRSSNVQTKNYFASNVQGSANPTLSFFNNALAGDTYGH